MKFKYPSPKFTYFVINLYTLQGLHELYCLCVPEYP